MRDTRKARRLAPVLFKVDFYTHKWTETPPENTDRNSSVQTESQLWQSRPSRGLRGSQRCEDAVLPPPEPAPQSPAPQSPAPGSSRRGRGTQVFPGVPVQRRKRLITSAALRRAGRGRGSPGASRTGPGPRGCSSAGSRCAAFLQHLVKAQRGGTEREGK